MGLSGEAFDHFLLFSEKQVRQIIKKYVVYYNTQRMHQSIDKIPDAKIQEGDGVTRKEQILWITHHYFRSSA
jgi:putative transposase